MNNDSFINWNGIKIKIGSIQDDTFYIVRDKPNDFVIKYKAYGFPQEIILDDSLNFEFIVITTKTKKYVTTRNILKDKNLCIYATPQGTEPRIYVPVEILTGFDINEEVFNKIREWKNNYKNGKV